MSVSLMHALAELTIALSAAIFVVALVRKPMRRIAGAQVAYWMWLLVPASTLVLAFPAPSRTSEVATQTFPNWVLSTFRAPTVSGHIVGAADYTTMGLFVWAVGGVSMLALMVCRQRAFIRSLGNLASVQDGTYRSMSVSGPVLIGIWRPRIVLPTDFETIYSRQECTLILAHERVHRRRGDILINTIAAISLCLFWFNPIMYWAIARFRFDQELACDATVLAESSSGRRCYADALLKTQLAAESTWRMPICCHWQSSHPLTERIAMLKRPVPGFARQLSGAVLTTALIISGSYAAWAAQPEPAHAVPLQDAGQRFTFFADHISRSASGDIDCSGNVVIKPTDSNGLEMTWNADTVNRTDDGSMVLEGSVRFSFATYVLTTDRATLFKDGSIKMDSAHLSQTSETH
jgi:bla regulator protein blaR1